MKIFHLLLSLMLTLFTFPFVDAKGFTGSIITNQTIEPEEPASDENAFLLTEDELEEAAQMIPAAPEKSSEAPSMLQPGGLHIDFKQVFYGSPLIYSILIALSMTALFLWLYTVLRWRTLGNFPYALMKRVKMQLKERKQEETRFLLNNRGDLLSRMLSVALTSGSTLKEEYEEVMQREIKGATCATWQRIGLLNDIALLAPMLGLMGTVLGMFYAFYDLNRSLDSITKLFDGLGISVATTVAGLFVALFSLLLHTFLKHRLIRRLNLLESETHAFLPLLVKLANGKQ